MFRDGQELPLLYADWLASANAVCEQIAEGGREPIRVEIDPDEFVLWCGLNCYRSTFEPETVTSSS